jgi:hypothetical protein
MSFCTNCGIRVEENWNVCAKCGKRIFRKSSSKSKSKKYKTNDESKKVSFIALFSIILIIYCTHTMFSSPNGITKTPIELASLECSSWTSEQMSFSEDFGTFQEFCKEVKGEARNTVFLCTSGLLLGVFLLIQTMPVKKRKRTQGKRKSRSKEKNHRNNVESNIPILRSHEDLIKDALGNDNDDDG